MATTETIRVLLVEGNSKDADFIVGRGAEDPERMVSFEHRRTLDAAIEALSSDTFDAVLLDLALPDSAGIDTFRRLYRMNPHLSIIVLTGLDDSELARACVGEGAQDYLIKGKVEGFLAAAIHNAVIRTRLTEELCRTKEELDRSNQVLRAGRGISRLIVQESDLERLIVRACDLLTTSAGYLSAWIALFREDGSVSAHAAANCPDFFSDSASKFDSETQPACRESARGSTDGVAVFSPQDACKSCPHFDVSRHGLAIAALLKIEEQEIGLMVVTLPGEAMVDRYEKELLADVTSNLALAVRDIQMAEAVRQSQEEIAALYAQTPLILFLVDGDSRIRHINKMAQEMTGEREENLIGLRSGEALRCIHAAASEEGCGFGAACERCVIRNTVLDTLHTGCAYYQVESPLVVKSEGGAQTEMTFLLSTTRLMMRGENQALVCLQNVTEERQMKASLAQSDRLASMGLLAAGVAHEINNPLIFILYNLESLSRDLPELSMGMQRCYDEFVRYAGEKEVLNRLGAWSEVYNPFMFSDLVNRAKQAVEGTERIRDIARGLGAFSRVEKKDVREVNLNSAVEFAVNMAHNEIKYRARLVMDLGKLPDIVGSEGRLAQVFLNLLINATHAIEAGDVENNVIHLRTWADADSIFAEVRDTGKGIEAAHLSRLYDPFFTTKAQGVGSGLGLSISKSIITELGGEIQVASEVGKGTAFTIRLPVPQHSARVCESPSPCSRMSSPGARGRVLVVDDEPIVRNTISRMLSDRHEVVAAASGEEGRRLLEQDHRFDAIICDLIMPKMSGMDLFEWLSDENANLARHMIFVTGGAFTPKIREFLGNIDNVQLDKPFTAGAVLAAVQQMMAAADKGALGHEYR